ncbi:hypothetical protein [Actinomadura graeca]|uniref:hypothetical protein n=1 Tax=Actinomadura graeca TaxID=2750812 RepID=UPI0030843CF0
MTDPRPWARLRAAPTGVPHAAGVGCSAAARRRSFMGSGVRAAEPASGCDTTSRPTWETSSSELAPSIVRGPFPARHGHREHVPVRVAGREVAEKPRHVQLVGVEVEGAGE